MARMGYEAEAHKIQGLFLAGKRDEAIMAVPCSFADEISLVGPPERIAGRLAAWRESSVSTTGDGQGSRAAADTGRADAVSRRRKPTP